MHTFWGLSLVNLASYVDGLGLAPKADSGAGRSPVIRADLTIAASPDQVFHALVDPSEIKRWFGWAAEVEPRVGGRMTLGVDGTISEFEPDKAHRVRRPVVDLEKDLNEALKPRPRASTGRCPLSPVTATTTQKHIGPWATWPVGLFTGWGYRYR